MTRMILTICACSMMLAVVAHAQTDPITEFAWSCDTLEDATPDKVTYDLHVGRELWLIQGPLGIISEDTDDPFSLDGSDSLWCPADDPNYPAQPGDDDWKHGEADLTGMDLSGEITIECWVKPNASGRAIEHIISVHNTPAAPNTTQMYMGIDATGQLYCRYYVQSAGTPLLETGVTIPVGQWTHLAMVASYGDSLTIYVNGVDEAVYLDGEFYEDAEGILHILNLSRVLPDGDLLALMVGTMWNSPGHWLDDIRITSSALTAEELGYHASFSPTDCEQVWASGFGMTGDANQDCYVGVADFAEIATSWQTCAAPDNPDCDAPWDIPVIE